MKEKKCENKLEYHEDCPHCVAGCDCEPIAESPAPDWYEELVFGIMEDYIRDAEMMHRSPEKTTKLRGHFEKLKSFIRTTVDEAEKREYERGTMETARGIGFAASQAGIAPRDLLNSENWKGIIEKIKEDAAQKERERLLEALDELKDLLMVRGNPSRELRKLVDKTVGGKEYKDYVEEVNEGIEEMSAAVRTLLGEKLK